MKARILMIVVLIGASMAVVAQPVDLDHGKPLHRPDLALLMNDGHRGGMAQALNLTDAQKESFKQSMLAVQKQLQPVRNQLGEAKAHQRTLMTDEKPDLNAINKNIEKMGNLKVEIAKILAKHRLEMRAQLTDEQRLKFDMLKHRMKPGNGPKGPMGMNRGMGHQAN